MFEDVDLSTFWTASRYGVGEPVTDSVVAAVERQLGYKLPRSYVALMSTQNGGYPRLSSHVAPANTWSEDHVQIGTFFPIGATGEKALGGMHGTQFWIDEWGYPPIGVYIADDPQGTCLFCLDYRACGPQGEPAVVYIENEVVVDGGRLIEIAASFEAFVRGLKDATAFRFPL